MPDKPRRVSIVSPCYNEELAIVPFHAELARVLDSIEGVEFTVILVDDGSRDQTLARLNEIAARDPRVRPYSLSRNFGHQIALSAGLDAARGDAVILMDSDLQHPPAMIPRMIELWRAGSDVVSAVREDTPDASAFKKWSSSLFYRVFNLLSDTKLVPGAADFCLLSRRAYKSIRTMPERHRFLRGLVAWVGFQRTLLPYVAVKRVAGESKYPPIKMLKLAAEAIFAFSTKPLHLCIRLGILIALAGMAYLLYAVIKLLAGGHVEKGWTSLITVVLVLGGTQLVFIGIVGEYIARVLEQVKERPLYLFKQQPARKKRRRRENVSVASTGDQQ